MFQGRKSNEHEVLAAIRNDEGLKELLRIHLAGPDAGPREEDAAPPDLIPALLGAYAGLDAIRHDFPAVLIDDDADAPVVSLASLFDDILASAAAAGSEGDGLYRDAYRLEAAIRRLAGRRPARRLSELWELAAEEMAQHAAQPARFRASLDALRRWLVRDGQLLCCSRAAARAVFEHAWGPLKAEKAREECEVLNKLIARLSEVLESERARSPKSRSPQALEAALGGEHAGGIDFEAMSSLLRNHGRARVTPVKRAKRLRDARKVLEAERAQLPAPNGNGARRRRARRPASICDSCAGALALFDEELQRRVELLRAIRVAKLELDNRYHADRHDPYFETFGPSQLTPREYRALPPVLVILDGDSLDHAERSALLQILGSDMPVKILLQVREAPADDPSNAPPGTFTEWTRQIAAMASSAGEAFVMQTAASHLPRLIPEIVRGLRYSGPALFSVYTGPDDQQCAVASYLQCASAVESRTFPSFVYDPDGGADLATRFSLGSSPQSDRAWPVHPFAYEDDDGREVIEDLAFTCIDFLALDPRFFRHFVAVPRSRWHANMIPVAQYLDLPSAQTFDKVPYVHVVDGNDRLCRVVVRRALVNFARKCSASWRRLQQLDLGHGASGLAHARAQADEDGPEAQPAAAGAAAPALDAGAADAGAAAPTDDTRAPAPAAAPADPPGSVPATGQAYIDTDLCTSCDDCIERNPQMFAYNEVKQAFVKDAAAGTYQELVEAAENCPVCIIHPGVPLHADEPGLDELKKRASAFN